MAKVDQLIGDGINTVFDLDVGFSTVDAVVQCFDLLHSNNIVFSFQLQNQTPNATSVRLTLTPAPALNSIRAIVTDGTETP